jgi:Domain of unknown function (DUF397)
MVEGKTPSGWRKSSFSTGGDCVEWVPTKTHVHLRASDDPSGPTLEFTHSQWLAFIAGVKSGEADLPAC